MTNSISSSDKVSLISTSTFDEGVEKSFSKKVSSIAFSVLDCFCCGALARRQILQIWNDRPSDESDFFVVKAHTALKEIKLSEYMGMPREQIIQKITSGLKLSIFHEIEMLRNFEKEFPEIYRARNYDKLFADLDAVLKKYGVDYREAKPSEEYSIHRDVLEDFAGTKLVLGCGHACKECGGHDAEDEYLLALHDSYGPDLRADYYSTSFWQEIPDEKFAEVYYEGFLPHASSSSLTQLARILKPGGCVRMAWKDDYMGDLCWAHKTDPKTFAEYIYNCGFSSYAVEGGESDEDLEYLILNK